MIARIDHAPFALRVRERLLIGDEQVARRQGVLVALRDDGGHCGFGEITPLPGLHRESVDDVVRVLPDVARALAHAAIEELRDVRRALSATAAGALPSVVFGIEMAWLGLRAQQTKTTRAELLGDAPAAQLAVAGLFDGTAEEAHAELERGTFARVRALKVKVGRRAIEQERDVVRALAENLGPHTRLRLDGNRGLSLPDACALIEGVDAGRIEYFEEPLAEVDGCGDLFERTGVHIALDETLRADGGEQRATAPWVAAWITKPAARGGFASTLELAERARAAGIACVISSCFESGLGLWALAELAAALPGRTHAAGLGTDRWLAEDLIEPAFDTSRGSVALSHRITTPTADRLRHLGLEEATAP